MDIIYSRKKIRLDKRKKLKLLILALVFIIFVLSIYCSISVYSIFISNCKSKANSIAVNIVNNEVQKIIKNYNYDDLVLIEKDNNEKITLIQAKTTGINMVVSSITENIQKSLDSTDTGIVDMNLGKITGITALSYIGPKVKIELERSRKN